MGELNPISVFLGGCICWGRNKRRSRIVEMCRVRENRFETLNLRGIVLDEESCKRGKN
jgi:hypothetical protein